MMENEQENVEVMDMVCCPKCGMKLAKDDLFCAQCGQKIDAFNEEVEKKAKKKKKIKKFLTCVAVALVVLAGVGVGVYKFYESKGEKIVKIMRQESFEADTVVAQYKELGPIGQALVRDELVDAFVDVVKANQYQSMYESEDVEGLVNSEVLAEYEEYKKVVKAMKITSKDGTNVVEYINAVLKLKKYEEYNGLIICTANSLEDYNTGIDYIVTASNSSYYTVMIYTRYALSYLEDAVEGAKANNSGDEMTTKYISAMEKVKDSMYNIVNGNGNLSSSAAEGMTEIAMLMNDMSDVMGKVKEIENELPELH